MSDDLRAASIDILVRSLNTSSTVSRGVISASATIVLMPGQTQNVIPAIGAMISAHTTVPDLISPTSKVQKPSESARPTRSGTTPNPMVSIPAHVSNISPIYTDFSSVSASATINTNMPNIGRPTVTTVVAVTINSLNTQVLPTHPTATNPTNTGLAPSVASALKVQTDLLENSPTSNILVAASSASLVPPYISSDAYFASISSPFASVIGSKQVANDGSSFAGPDPTASTTFSSFSQSPSPPIDAIIISAFGNQSPGITYSKVTATSTVLPLLASEDVHQSSADGEMIPDGTLITGLQSSSQRHLLLAVGGQILTANPSGLLLADTTLWPGGPAISISGTPLSLGTFGVVIGANTMSFQKSAPLLISSTFTTARQTSTANLKESATSGTPLLSDGRTASVSGTTKSLGSASADEGGSTFTQPIPTSTPIPTPAIFTLGAQVFTHNPTEVTIAGKPLSSSGPAVTTVDKPISLGTSGLVIDLTIITLTISSSSQPTESIVDFSGHTMTSNPSESPLDGTILLPGSAIPVSGTALSPDSSNLHVGNSTIPLSSTALNNDTVPLLNSTFSNYASDAVTTTTSNLLSTATFTTVNTQGSSNAKTSPPHPTKGAAARELLSSGHLIQFIWVMVLYETRGWIA